MGNFSIYRSRERFTWETEHTRKHIKKGPKKLFNSFFFLSFWGCINSQISQETEKRLSFFMSCELYQRLLVRRDAFKCKIHTENSSLSCRLFSQVNNSKIIVFKNSISPSPSQPADDSDGEDSLFILFSQLNIGNVPSFSVCNNCRASAVILRVRWSSQRDKHISFFLFMMMMSSKRCGSPV